MDAVSVDEIAQTGPSLRLTDLVAELRQRDPDWSASVKRTQDYRRGQDELYRQRHAQLCVTTMSPPTTPSVRFSRYMECLCGQHIVERPDGSRINQDGSLHGCDRMPRPDFSAADLRRAEELRRRLEAAARPEPTPKPVAVTPQQVLRPVATQLRGFVTIEPLEDEGGEA